LLTWDVVKDGGCEAIVGRGAISPFYSGRRRPATLPVIDELMLRLDREGIHVQVLEDLNPDLQLRKNTNQTIASTKAAIPS
jgi:hypothetical protein